MKNLALIPPKYYVKRIYQRKIIGNIIVAIVVISIVGFMTSFLGIIEKGLQNRSKMIDRNISQIENDYQKGYQYEYLSAMCRNREETYKKITIDISNKGIDIQKIYRHMEICSPENLTIDSMSITENTDNIKKVNLSGYAKGNKDIQKFVDSLERDSIFNSVKLNNVKLVKDNISYTIDLNVE